ncbi:MAG TPA: glycerol-3-phosphate 1-O-acyltransferase PlsY [Clostridia bacterium]|nr:glycerol-3-phosphate 1-O-acyltransferase PlsY [Clostridia bacterium]
MYLLILAAAAGYLLGSLNSALIVGKFHGVDVRQHGSGNAGMTNTMRTLGKKAALFVLLGDVLKGLLSFLIGYFVCGSQLGGMVAGTAAIIGHILPVYFGFKGGKGVLTTLAVLFMFDWRAALALLGVFIVILALTRFVSLGSIIGAFLFPFAEILLGRGTETIVFSAVIAVLIIVMHRANIKRLLSGTESKFSFSKKKEG